MTLNIRTAALGVFGTGVALLLSSAPMSGHHEPAAKFDPAKPITLKGTVSKIDWLNPHVHIFMEVPDINAVIKSLDGAEVVQGLHETFYGAREVVAKEPGGHFVIFSQLPAQSTK